MYMKCELKRLQGFIRLKPSSTKNFAADSDCKTSMNCSSPMNFSLLQRYVCHVKSYRYFESTYASQEVFYSKFSNYQQNKRTYVDGVVLRHVAWQRLCENPVIHTTCKFETLCKPSYNVE